MTNIQSARERKLFMNSMTGYGRAVLTEGAKELTVELKSVNHRYLDISVRGPKILNPYEDIIRKTLAEVFERGHIDVFLNYADLSASKKRVAIDKVLAKDIYVNAADLAKELKIKNDLTLTSLLKTGEVLNFLAGSEEEDLSSFVKSALLSACKSLGEMRAKEGEKLLGIMSARLDKIEELYQDTKKQAPVVCVEYSQKLKERITEALQGVDLDEGRFANEVACYIDKSNIDEELDRLNSHISQARGFINAQANTGRKLDFLIQEMNREVNTICSKANNLTITNLGVELKNEIEKLREQCQNIE